MSNLTGAATVLWLRNDLRLADNRALAAVLANGGPVVPLYVLDEAAAGRWAPGGASRWWLHHSLTALGKAFDEKGSRLVLRRGPAAKILVDFAARLGAKEVVCQRRYEPWAIAQEREVKAALDAAGVALQRFGGALLVEPEQIGTQTGAPYKVYTPFWRALSSGLEATAPLKAPKSIPAPATWPKSDTLSSWALLPRKLDWAKGFAAQWQPGEAGALARLDGFLDEQAFRYGELRNRPDLPATSRLSPHLAHGEISPRLIWWRVAVERARAKGADAGLETFLKEIAWREFAAHLLFHFPQFPDSPFRPEFERFAWARDDAALKAWQRGRTGFPIVDAGMRELWSTGWMHNRVRMIVASFLIKDLLIPWQDGQAWFWDTLVDADLASNAASWQWVAGSGADAAPYFRIFNPVTQGQKFDPDGAYVRRYVPELTRLGNRDIHEPFAAGDLTLAAAGMTLGETYPLPLVDHARARARALEAFARMST